MIGQQLNQRYTITARLGKGAMGTVYRATDSQTGHDVALKVISNELAVDPAMLERFKREGEALQQLKHLNIVGFMDAFQHDEHYVIVMEYVPGGSLLELIKAGPLAIEHAHQITLDLCDALIRSHRLNIIHRDIKPENVLIAEDGTPKLADFGVAHLSEGTRITRTGTQVGTPYYMAPEAWTGNTNAQSDIWSLGVVLFEMLTAQVPFDGDTGPVVMNKVLTTAPPDLKKLRADVPSGLVTIIGRMLTRDKKRRYQTMREVAFELERAQLATTPKSADEKTESQGASRRDAIKTLLPRLVPFLKIIGIFGIIIILSWVGSLVLPQLPLLIPTVTPSATKTSIETSLATKASPTNTPDNGTSASKILISSDYGRLLYEDNFDIDNESWWMEGKSTIKDGVLTLQPNTSAGQKSDNQYSDFIFETVFRHINPDGNSETDIYLRQQIPRCPGWNCSIQIWASGDWKTLGSRRVMGDDGATRILYDFSASELSTNDWNKITIIVKGDEYKIFVNNTFVVSFTDSIFKIGTFALASNPGATAFDYVKIYALP